MPDPEFTQPVRNILASTRSLRGQLSSTKLEQPPPYESSLERDWLQLLDFDEDIEFYCVQPLTWSISTTGSCATTRPTC